MRARAATTAGNGDPAPARGAGGRHGIPHRDRRPHDRADHDDFSFVTGLATGQVGVTLRTAGISLVTPRVTVYDAAGHTVASAAATDPLTGGFVVRLDHVTPLSRYYVKVESARQDAFGIGSYQLTVAFRSLSGSGTLTSAVKSTVSVRSRACSPATTSTATTSSTMPATCRSSPVRPTAVSTCVPGPDQRRHGRGLLPDPGAAASCRGALTAMVWGMPGGLDPRVRVFDAHYRPVAAEVLVNDDLELYRFQVRGAVPRATYYVEVLAANPGDVGDYRLGVDFSPATIDLVDYVGGLLRAPQTSGKLRSLTLAAEPSSSTLCCLPARPARAPTPTVQMTITDAAGRVVFSLGGTTGNPSAAICAAARHLRRAYSGPPSDRNRVAAAELSLGGEITDDPIGPAPGGDPNGDPGNPFTGVQQDVAVGILLRLERLATTPSVRTYDVHGHGDSQWHPAGERHHRARSSSTTTARF